MKLTDEQIAELAPEWATHYSICRVFDGILFESDYFFAFFYFDGGGFSERRSQMCVGINPNSKPIPLKPKSFDITQHEWSDIDSDYESVNASCLDVKFYLTDREDLTINKKDTIALAKHFGLTAEDLKC